MLITYAHPDQNRNPGMFPTNKNLDYRILPYILPFGPALLFKFDSIEFSPLSYIQAVIPHGEGVVPVKLAEACPEPAEADGFAGRVD